MIRITKFSENTLSYPELDKYKLTHRHLQVQEIATLIKNHNTSSDPEWKNILVKKDSFDPNLIHNCNLSGYIVLGTLNKSTLQYHDLKLVEGLYNSYIENCIIGDNCVIRNVTYLVNYHIGQRVILFNIQEMSCTNHSKFGNGILKEGEPESNRIWIGICNENDGRAVLPFEKMITADAYLWSRYRDDKILMNRFIDITEADFSKNLNTFGIVEDDVVIKNTTLLKDAKIGSNAYIKGAFKLKNITVLSTEEEPSQIGEGVELVNGIMGTGSRVFYQAVAVRFVLGKNCQLKYGGRLLNSILGDNSTVSCCELLNNLIFPFHEQHHNSSFLIATTVMGQSNIAAGATVGSNHNSRSPDGEIIAGRGFWPGLNSSFKHNSKFSNFVLIAKGSYAQELNITYPFSLVTSQGPEQSIHIIPAYWFMYNMFAIARNNSKFKKRDKRVKKIQHIETNPLAPDSIQEVLIAINRIIELTGRYLQQKGEKEALKTHNAEELYTVAKDYLHQHKDANFTLTDMQCQKKYGAIICKPVKAYIEYRKIVKYFAMTCLLDYCKALEKSSLTLTDIETIEMLPLYTSWINAGGQIIPEQKIKELFENIKSNKINSWDEIHNFYDTCESQYLEYKTSYAIYLLEQLYSKPIKEFSSTIFSDIINDVTIVSDSMYKASIESREKDFTDYFRCMTYRNKEEMTAVLGTLKDNSFLNELKEDTAEFDEKLQKIFCKLY